MKHFPWFSTSPRLAGSQVQSALCAALFCTFGLAQLPVAQASSPLSISPPSPDLRLAQMDDAEEGPSSGADDEVPTPPQRQSSIPKKPASATSKKPASAASKSPSQNGLRKGDAVEAWNVAWYTAHILEVGTGEHQGYYKVRYEDFPSASGQWVQAKNVRARQTPRVYSGPPRSGKYLLLGYGNPSMPLPLGYFILSGGNRYRFYNMGNTLIGSGRYRFNAASNSVEWQSGPFKKNGWGGKFAISREGKTHSITVNRATVGSNSTDTR